MKLLKALLKETVAPPPIWLMRQAGRYLPEYREVRKRAGSFLNLCLNPELAAEVTLQPIRRFGFDAAIIFADILLVPLALGRDLTFQEGEGPQMTPLALADDFTFLNYNPATVQPLGESLRLVRKNLPEDKALIGFCGAPWTVACYMIDGKGKTGFPEARRWATDHPAELDALINRLVTASAEYLVMQCQAGAHALQIFDSWAGHLSGAAFDRFCIQPTKRLIALVRKQYPAMPIIGFPRGATAADSLRYATETGISGISIGQEMALSEAKALQKHCAVQGNLDPALLVQGGTAMREAVTAILHELGRGPHIFNLGHGITPDVPPSHVAELVKLVRAGG